LLLLGIRYNILASQLLHFFHSIDQLQTGAKLNFSTEHS
jgi:hypothetical protein